MRGSIALLLPVAVSAAPTVDPKLINALFCKANNLVLTVLEKDAAATKYCSSFLSIPTSTFSATATVTPASLTTTTPITITADTVTSTQTQTATVTETDTITSTSTSTDYATITSTTSTSTITCLNSAYTYTAPVGVVPSDGGDSSAPAPEGKRGAATYSKPSAIPNNWSNQYISSACSCLSIPTPSVTSTTTTTLVPGTITETSTINETPSATATTTETETATETSTATAIETTTSTITAYAVETTIASNGVQYRKYTHSFNANNGDGGFTSTYFKGRTAEFSGALTSLSFSTPNWPSGSSTLTLSDGRSFVSDQAALLLQGFFIAKETGTYTFTSSGNDVDNYGYAWSRDSAYSAWDDTNAAFKSSRTAAAYITGATTLVLNAGDAVPFTYLWANGGGVGQSKVYIRSPSGQQTTNSAGYFVQACSSSVFA